MSKRWGTGTCVIPAPREVDEIMKKVPKGKLITINEIRQILAKKHKATIGCPITTGIFAWIAANAADEDTKQGKNHPLLAHTQNRWNHKRKVSRRNTGSEETFKQGRT